mgnify:CR=1 FL=1
MIEGLQIQNDTQNGKVFYHPAVLTVRGVSQYRDDEISFVEISGFWSLKYEPKAYVYSSAPREEGTNPGDGKLHVGDVAKFGLNINPKSSGNSFYNNISSVMPANGETPIERVQSQGQPAAQSGGSWASDAGSSGSEPFVDKWFPVAVSDLEEEVVAEDSPMVEAAVDLGADVIEEDVESVSWD